MTPAVGSVGDASRRTARGAAVRGVAEVGGKVATLAWTVVAARMLTATDFGVVSFGLATMLLVSTLPAWGFDAGVIRRGAAEPEHLDTIYSATQWWKTALAVPVMIVTAVVMVLGHDDVVARLTVLLILVALLPEVWSKTVRSASSARQRARDVSSALLAQRVVTALLIVAVLAAGGGSAAVAGAFLCGTLIGWAAHVVALRRVGLVRTPGLPTRDDLARAARGTWLIGLNGLLLMLLMRVDMIFLGGMQGAAAVAVYAIAYRLLETVLFVTYAVNQAVFPVLSATRDLDRWRRGYERSLSVAAFVYLPFVAVCVTDGPAVIGLLFGERYRTESGLILLWLAPSALFFAAAFFASTLLMAMERPLPMLLATAVAAAVNLALNAALIPQWSGVGAAVATTVAFGVQAVGVHFAIRSTGVAPRLLGPVLPALVASLALALGLWLAPWPLLVELVVGAAFYIALWLIVVKRVDPVQRDVLIGLVKRT
ncbi:oligosaccharide flippase family protein [Janibacter alittae]|uniref:Oligosaccharide flippase family protein n=1 Tax=Janibacter alittae TaxID=3115209 RepID=A0ABZ2MGH2_9MICO